MGSKLLLACLVPSLYLSDGATLGEGQMGMTELIQMKSDLQDRLRSGVKINDTEVETWELFETLFENTTIEYIKAEFEDIGGALNDSWDVVTGCHSTLKGEQDGSWSTKSNTKNTAWKTHDDCRTNQPDPNCNKTCSRCKEWVESILIADTSKTSKTTTPPSGSIKTDADEHRVPVFNDCETSDCWGNFGNDEHNTTITEWFKKYHDWHCTEDTMCPDGPTDDQSLVPYDCWVNCTHQCSAEETDWLNNATACDEDQDDFEDALCDLFTTLEDSCESYDLCRSGNVASGGSNAGADEDYKAEKTRVQALEETLQAEYQMVKSIICLIKLLLKNPQAEITDAEIEDCGIYYDTPCPTLALCIPEVANWDTAVNCECTVFPNAASCSCGDATDPGWCDDSDCETQTGGITGDECGYKNRAPNLNNCTEFEALYYTSRDWWQSIGSCDTDDDVTEVITQTCTSDRATARGC